MHQFSKFCFIFYLGIYIYDMRFIPKHYTFFFNCPVYMINRYTRFQYIILCYKNNIRLCKILIIICS